MNYIGGRHDRVLSIYSNLMDGRAVNVKSAAEYYGVSTRTIKRDIDDIRSFLFEQGAESGVYKEVLYDRTKDNYYLTGANKLSSRELFALCKVLLESRAFCKDEFNSLLDKTIEFCANDNDLIHIKDMIANERFHYCEPAHKKAIVDTIWDLSVAIKNYNRIKIVYERLTEPKHKERIIEPVGLMFSDFYFYLAAFIPEKQTQFPTIYRVDRISDLKVLKENFKVPYSNRFKEGEFRKRIQFMYGGDLLRIEFKYFGESVESVLDRLPTAEIISQKKGEYLIKAEVYGRGIKPWILSQTDKIELLKPAELRDEIKDLVAKIHEIYQ